MGDSGTDDDDGIQLPDVDNGGIGDAVPPTTEEPQGQRETQSQRPFSPFTGEDTFAHAT